MVGYIKKIVTITSIAAILLSAASCKKNQGDNTMSSEITGSSQFTPNVTDSSQDLHGESTHEGSIESGGSGKTGTKTTSSASAGKKTTSTKTSSHGKVSTPEGDTSFKLKTPELPKNTLYLLSKSVFTEFAGTKQHDVVRLVTSLQGIINREFETNRVILYWADVDTNDGFWKTYLQKSGKLFSGLKEVKIDSFDTFLTTFAKALKTCGLVVWDPRVASTANVAATICGLDGYLPVRFNISSGSVYNKLKDMGVEVRLSLVNMFKETGTIPDIGQKSTGSAKNDAYIWAMEKYMSRCSNKYMAYMPDGASCEDTNPIYSKNGSPGPHYSQIFNHDYLIARRSFFVDLLPSAAEAPCDDKAQKVGTDLSTLKSILQKRYDLAGGAFGQIIGFIPWHLKYTAYNNWNTLIATELEWEFACLLTSYNLAKEADAAHPCWVTNCSAYYKSPAKAVYTNNKPAKKKKFDPNTIYLMIYLGDYDNSIWMKEHVPTYWKDVNKSSGPNNWGFNPNHFDRIPMVFDYVYENMGSNDFYITGDSGAGYVTPYALYKDAFIRPRASGDQAWLTYNKPYSQRLGMDICGFIINGWQRLDVNAIDLYSKMYPAGNFHNTTGMPLVLYNGVPFIHLNNGIAGIGQVNVSRAATDMYQYINSTMKNFNFAAFRTICISPTEHKQIRDEFAKLVASKKDGKNYEFVDAYTFFDLIKQSGQGTKIK